MTGKTILLMTVLTLVFNFQHLFAQTADSSAESPFIRWHFPTYNSDYSYYMLRNDLTLDHSLIGLNVTRDSKDFTDFRGKAFMPLVDTEKFDFALPVYMYRDTLTADDSKATYDKQIFNFFWQSLFQYYPTDDLTCVFITESRTKGTSDSFTQSPGNEIGGLLLVKYRITNSLYLAPLGRVQYYWYDDREELKPVGGGQLIWVPSSDFKAMVGVPGLLGIEWAMPYDFDLMVNVMLQDMGVPAVVALRKRWTDRFDTIIRYIREGQNGLYVYEESIKIDDNVTRYNNITYYKDIMQIELGFNTSATSLIQIKGGYYLTEDIELKNDDKKVASLKGANDFMLGINVMSKFK